MKQLISNLSNISTDDYRHMNLASDFASSSSSQLESFDIKELSIIIYHLDRLG